MYQVDEKLETIHLYVVREKAPKPSWLPIVLSVIAFLLLILAGIVSPYKQPVTRSVIRVPVVLLPIRTFSANVAIIPTGIKTYPAVASHGILTITNGSIIGQSIPAGFTIQGVITDYAVYVPGGNANGYGSATISAHALSSGKIGNISAFTINAVIGSSVYIRNLSAFSGGRDSYSVKFITPQDKSLALMKSRTRLASLVTGLHYPCSERVSGATTVIWHCLFVTYSVPAYMHIIGVQLAGRYILVSVTYILRPTPRHWVK